jgi:hypothetical protein
VQVETWQAAYAHALSSEQLQALSLEEAVERHPRWPPTFVAEHGGEIRIFGFEISEVSYAKRL